MSTKQVLFRLDDSILTSFDSKLSEKGISKQFFFTKCVELFVGGDLSLDDSNVISNDSEVDTIKKQLADILARLTKLENDSNMIANDKSLTSSTVEPLSLENELESKANDEGRMIPESSPKADTDDFERAKITEETRLTTKELLRRLGKDDKNNCLSLWEKNETLEVKTAELDPDGISWQFDSQEARNKPKIYKPII